MNAREEMGNISVLDSPKKLDDATQHLANERTFLAWLRTSVVLIGLGFVIVRFTLFTVEFRYMVSDLPGLRLDAANIAALYLGAAIVALGVGLTIYAVKIYIDTPRAIEKGAYISDHKIICVSALGVVALGAVLIVYLLLLLF